MGPRRRSPRLLALGAAGSDLISALPDDLLLLILARLECAAAAVRTGVLSRRWRGLWPRLRRIVFSDVALLSLEAALGRFPPPPPAVSLLKIRIPKPRGCIPKADTARVSSLLRAAARLDPEELFMVIPSGLVSGALVLDLPNFHRATSIVLDLDNYGDKPTICRVPAGVELPALETLSLSGCAADFETLLSRCPRLRTLRLADFWFDDGDLRINLPLLHELVVAGGSWIYHVNIVAPLLKQLTMSIHLHGEVNISILAPMMEKVLWDCSISGSTKFGFWRVTKITLQAAERQGHLRSLHIHANIKLSSFYDEGDKFTQEIEKHLVADFSVLELHLITGGHVFGAFLCHLLGMNRIGCAIQMLKVDLQRSVMNERCLPYCHCDSPNWKAQTISLTSLKEVEINGFEGVDHEFDLLKLILRCAPMLKRINIKLSHEASASRSNKICNLVMAYSSVECYIYLSSGSFMAASWLT